MRPTTDSIASRHENAFWRMPSASSTALRCHRSSAMSSSSWAHSNGEAPHDLPKVGSVAMLKGVMRLALLALLACLSATAVPPASAAQPSALKVDTRVVAEVTTIRAGEPFWIALHQKITPGWHTYWRNPGDSGEPVTLAWSLPPGFVADDIAWPVPERIPVGPVVSFGFSNEVLLPIRVTPPAGLEAGQQIGRASC